MTDRLDRRALLAGEANPAPRHDYVVELTGRVGGGCPATVRLRYVPDRLILVAAGWGRYLAALDDFPSLEQLAAIISEDLGNELVPRWSQIALASEDAGHAVLLEDRQPTWDNPRLLARLRRW